MELVAGGRRQGPRSEERLLRRESDTKSLKNKSISIPNHPPASASSSFLGSLDD